MAEQMTSAAQTLGFDELVLLDVGGDALTTGDDPGLRSPLADQLVIAAAARTGLPARLVIAGAGLDGEIPAEVVNVRLAQLDETELPPLTSAAAIRDVFTWHPSEASGLLGAAADGRRGYVEVRDTGDRVYLSHETTRLAAVDVERALAIVPARHLLDADTLRQSERIVQAQTSISEIEYETAKAGKRRTQPCHDVSAADLNVVDVLAMEAGDRGSDYISTRRLAELLGVRTLDGFAELGAVLTEFRRDRYEPSLLRV
jgi:hypothetical protein